jgi:O-antigen ligase
MPGASRRVPSMSSLTRQDTGAVAALPRSALDVLSWLLIAVLAWAPFPLGSNRPWSWSLLGLLIALCWAWWALSAPARAGADTRLARRVAGPACLAAVALLWGVVQMLPIVPAGWTHPLWPLAGRALGHDLPATVSLNAWRTGTELMKLSSYAMMAWLCYVVAQDSTRAARLLDALIVIGTLYALYALILGLVGFRQFLLFYDGPAVGGPLAGPFVGRNSFATYAGLTTLCALLRLFALARETIVTTRGFSPLGASSLHLLFGRGFPAAFAAIVNFSLVVASASRGGFLAMLAALLVLAAIAARRTRGAASRWSVTGVVCLAAAGLALFLLNGDTLQARLDQLMQQGGADDVRLALWSAAGRMVADAPLLGLGLGSFENAYPLYADQVLPYVMDRAHNDYLELAAGWGIPAAAAWWLAILWLNVICLRGVFQRRRDHIYPLLALGATALVGAQSAFDFSLQIPAVALTYAAILGLGVAQAFPSRERAA